MALRDGFDDPVLRALEGELVKLTVGNKEYVVEPGDLTEAQAWWDGIRPAGTLTPTHDLSVVGLVDLTDAGVTSQASVGTSAIGAKAANFAEMMRITSPRTLRMPLPAYALPFSAFDRHMTDHGLWAVLDAILADQASLSHTELAARLFELRWAIYQAPMAAETLDPLIATIGAEYADRELRFRSSTNVEDLAEFSGAGLYTSAGASLAAGPQAIENAVKVVWASAYNPAAFVERDFYRVDHREVRMGVLIHPSFEDELANGVAITINEFTELRPAYYINAQVGEVSVTNPTGDAVPEQILWYTWYEEPEYEVLSRSSLTGGAPVLTEGEYLELADQLRLIHLHFRPIFCQSEPGGPLLPGCGADVEWKLASDGMIYVKQARPMRGAPQ
jgi:phosphoenolpyruvate synthase/pyruvate phosphate dikinase